MNLSPEEKQIGQDNFHDVLGVTRRDFMKSVAAAGAVSGMGLGAMYFGYSKVDDPVRIGIIGTGDEGSVLIGACNPDYVKVVAIADIRPFNLHRAFYGDWASDNTLRVRPGLCKRYGYKDRAEAEKEIKVYDANNGGYQELLKNKDIEAVIIAVPLHLHARVAIDAMMAGKHVLTEKLMAHNVAQCKIMGRIAEQQDVYLATGHQRHYSVLYDNAVHMIRHGLLGELHHIRAQWHRGNVPGNDSWAQPIPGGEKVMVDGEEKHIDKILSDLQSMEGKLAKEKDPKKKAIYAGRIEQWRAWNMDKDLDASAFGYQAGANGLPASALEELCRWRLWERTGGGLMAELGSHQLDAASIFISALRADGQKARPLSVHGVGGRHIFPNDRDAGDHVYCMFEFPAPGYDPKFDAGYKDPFSNYPDPDKGIPGYDVDPNKRIVVTYSSINGNGFGGYGEVVMGTKGTLVLEREQEVMLYQGSSTSSRVSVKNDSATTMDTTASGDMSVAIARAADTGPPSRGYTEEIEHWAYCIRNKAPENKPRCYPAVALGDAVIALTANIAIQNSQSGRGGYIEFKDEWFDINSDEVPSALSNDGKPLVDFQAEYDKLVKG
ncbi:MAG: Gfo/Idh/MocA family oxidoreductase [Planctomycetales bacterium]|nr:Gfo/Idh/MocA family oxidoreductase [Planctomycetales bacterium]